MHISRDGCAYKDDADGQYIIVNFAKNQLITILSTEPEMQYVTEILICHSTYTLILMHYYTIKRRFVIYFE